MKKNILMALLVSLALVLTGCGSGDFDIDGGHDGNDTNSSISGNPEGGGAGSSTTLRFFNPTTPLNITEANQTYAIKVQVLENGKVSSGKTVDLLPFNSAYGHVDTYSAQSAADGYAVFHYTSPSTNVFPTGSTTLHLSLDQNGTAVAQQDIHLDFNLSSAPSVPSISTVGVSLLAAPNQITITKPGESKALPLYVANANGPMQNVQINAKWFDPNTGTLDTYSATTNTNGQVVFNYTAPVSLPSSDINITFEVANGQPALSKNVTVKFGGSTTPPLDTTGMTLTATPSPVQIKNGGESKVISFYLSKGNNVVANTEITAHFFDPNTGTLDTYSATTNTNGQAVFNYTAPESLPSSDLSITFEVANGQPVLSKNVTVKFDHTLYTLRADTNITVTDISQQKNIEVYLTKIEAGITKPAVGKTVVMDFVQSTYGTVASYEATVGDDGKAVFSYTSPARKLPDTNTTLHVYYKDDMSVTKTIDLLYDPQVVDTIEKMFVTPDTITITAPNEERNITIVTVNDRNLGIAANVSLEQPNNGTDYGTFDTNNVKTNASGYAVVKYTAPSDISNLSERNITITEQSKNLQHTLHIKFGAVESQVTEYEIVATTPSKFTVDKSDSFKIEIAEIGNHSNIINDSNVHEVNLTIEPVSMDMISFQGDANSFQYDSLGTNSNIAIKSKHLSGVALIDVSASIYNGDGNVTITQTIPVTIMSGPVAAVTIPYVSTKKCETDPNGELWAERYIVHAVDQYSNPAQNIQIAPSLVNGTKTIKIGSHSGTLNVSKTFSDTTAHYNADNIKPGDVVMVLPNEDRQDYSYLGNWRVDSVNSDTSLQVTESYTGQSPTSNLSYVIGDEDRLLGGDEQAAHIVNKDNNYTTDENGLLLLEACFDPALAGHTFVVGAYAKDTNSSGGVVRAGIASRKAFRWGNFSSTTVEVDNDGQDHLISLHLLISGSIHENLSQALIARNSFTVNNIHHCYVTTIGDNKTDDYGNLAVVLHTDGQNDPKATPAGVETCTATWDAKMGNILYEY